MSDRFHTTRIGVAVAVAAIIAALAIAAPAGAAPTGLVCTDGSLNTGTNTRSFELTARDGTMETPDGNSALMWSYAVTGGSFQTPGPILCANEGETVKVTLSNTLNAPTSIVFPGQKNVTATGDATGFFTKEAAANTGAATYTFEAAKPGTYVYESGTDPGKQVEMGLASAIVIRPAGHPNWAYGNSSTEFNPQREFIMLLNEIDPELHQAVENSQPYDILSLHNRYYTINGRSFPDTVQDNNVAWMPTQPYGALVNIKPFDATTNPLPALIRIVNVGLQNHPFHPHAESLRYIGKDGHLNLTASGGDAATEHFGETVPSGATEDYLLSFRDQDSFGLDKPVPISFPSYRDQTFKDSNTWYSGSPYLGTVGTLPDGTTSQNVCGAFFFPWHSHALQEFTNYNLAGGGMGTLLRVDPPTGCATPGYDTLDAEPDAVTITTGTLSGGGDVTGLAAKGDGNRYSVRSTNNAPRTSAWYGTFTGVPDGVKNLIVHYTGRNRRDDNNNASFSCTQTVRIWKWSTSTWVNLDTEVVNRNDTDIPDPVAPGPDSQYIGTGANEGRVRVGVLCTTPTVPSTRRFISSGDLLQITYDAAP
jgi:FtsP/CotA-like multicopper oxidase with cupredoxin domain